MDFEIERRALFEKRKGIVHLSTTHFVWTPDSAADGRDLRIAYAAVKQYQVSKAGAKKAMIKIHSSDRSSPVMLDFGTSFDDRDAVRDVLNRVLTPAGAANISTAPGVAQAPRNVPSVPQPSVSWSSLSAEERTWRQALMRKKDVIVLHRDLVGAGHVNDDKFWKGMKCKYKMNGQRGGVTASELKEGSSTGKVKGVPSSAFAGGPEMVSEAKIVWVNDAPSPADRHRIFMEHPSVGLAYRAKVLDAQVETRMTEASFWNSYRQSSMAQTHVKGTKRAAAVATEADALFAEYHVQKQSLKNVEDMKRASLVDQSINMDRFDDHRQEHVRETPVLSTVGGSSRVKGSKSNAAGETRGLDIMRKLNMHGTMVLDGHKEGLKEPWRESDDLRTHPLKHLELQTPPVYTKLSLDSSRAVQASIVSTTDNLEGAGDGSTTGGGARELQEFAREICVDFIAWEPQLHLYSEGSTDNSTVLDGLLLRMKP